MFRDGIFREYDIRGVVGRDFDEEFAATLGGVLGELIRERIRDARWVSVGWDARLSSERLAARVIEGFTAAGLNVYEIGLCPTPLQYFSLYHLDLDGGVMVTGSHNPPEYNGFKLSVGKETLFGEEIQTIKKRMHAHSSVRTSTEGTVERYDIRAAYRAFVLDRFSYLNDDRFRTIRVVVDAGNGTAGVVAPEILEAIGCEVIPLYCEPDGRFPNHHPDPTVVEYIQDLIRTTRERGADFGVGYDGDADRIGIVNRDGTIVWGDEIMIILSRDILMRRPGSVIIGDVKCSQRMFEDIANKGGKPLMWKTGHSLVKNKMRQERAVLAGEFSGHIFIGDDYFGFDDAIYTTIRLVEIMKKTGFGMADLLSGVPRTVSTPEIRIPCPDDRKKTVVEMIARRCSDYARSGKSPIPIRDIHEIDGARLVFERGWGLVRHSNTQPVIVMRFEADDEESLRAYRSFLEEELKVVQEKVCGMDSTDSRQQRKEHTE